jgi:DNA adenine methylase
MEPFLGAASMFLALRPERAHLADANQHLIRCYQAIRDKHEGVFRHLRHHVLRDCADYYYEVREAYNRLSPSAAQAARFLYLNRTCFNGIFRVNTRGEFNVPYGYKDDPVFPDRYLLGTVAEALRKAELVAADYEDSLAAAQTGDFLYLDPPYPPLNGTSYFTHYTKDRFGAADQETLAEWVSHLDQKGCLFMMSNADTRMIRRLYRYFHVARLPVTRYVTCKATKHRVGELVITNY